MTTPDTDNLASIEPTGIAMRLDYAQPSQLLSRPLSQAQAESYHDHVALFAQLNRPNVAFHGQVKTPLLFRDCLTALFDIVSADYRYVPKDRSAYTAFMQMRRASANDNLFASQRAYFDWLFNNDPLAYCILDPIVQVHADGVTFEVFSKDEGCYASLTFTHALFDNVGATTFGTTYVDYSPALLQGIRQIRSYRDTSLDIGQEAMTLDTAKTDLTTDTATKTIEKRINVSKSWIRALLQVQSASQLSHDSFELDPVSLYNLLFEMRMHADIKGKKRGLLIELVPNQAPVLTLEPFGIVVKSQGASYRGTSAKLLRLWGRRRLALLKRVLPYTDNIRVTLLGQGMPSYWTLTGVGFSLSFAMTGFSQANWSQALNFDLLLPKRPTDDSHERSQATLLDITTALQTPQSLDVLAKQLGKKPADLRPLLMQLAQQGLVRYELANAHYVYRPLTDVPLAMADLAYHNLAEKHAYELISRPDAISKLSVDAMPTLQGASGVAISADVYVAEDRRTYHSQLQLNDEGMVTRADCSCPQFLQHRLTQGVCSHLIALRLAYADFAQRDPNKDKQLRFSQTKLFSRRSMKDENAITSMDTPELREQVQLTLKQKKLIIERHDGKQAGRQQRLFNHPEQAYDAFLTHIAKLQSAGYLENQVI